ncbi:MAG TPA: preprotein translocase subunit SecE [Propionibacteriaceae bacterium]|nr:preprotein translocase subunit SecE [Propionibacteriaceae bacterium]
MADTDDADSTNESGAAPADRPTDDADTPTGRRSGSHALGASDDGARDHEGPLEDPEDKQLVAVGAAGRPQEANADIDGSVVARGDKRDKKAKATPKQKQVAEQERRTGPITFLRESVSELQKVVYPTGQQLVNYFVVVLIFVLFIIAIVTALDFAFGKAILAVFS